MDISVILKTFPKVRVIVSGYDRCRQFILKFQQIVGFYRFTAVIVRLSLARYLFDALWSYILRTSFRYSSQVTSIWWATEIHDSAVSLFRWFHWLGLAAMFMQDKKTITWCTSEKSISVVWYGHFTARGRLYQWCLLGLRCDLCKDGIGKSIAPCCLLFHDV